MRICVDEQAFYRKERDITILLIVRSSKKIIEFVR